MENQIIRIYHKLKNHKLKISDLYELKSLIAGYVETAIKNKGKNCTIEGIYSALMLCLDQYTYSETGDVLVSDHTYDLLHTLYIDLGGTQLIYPDHIETRWNMEKHKKPYLVGSLRKVYEIKDLQNYIYELCKSEDVSLAEIPWIISPKYDGISACLEFSNHKLVQALTRGDDGGSGREGQDITAMAVHIMNMRELESKIEHGFLKVELVCPSESFEYLKEEYENRRSATTAIVNTPKNIKYGHFIYAIPLMYDQDNGSVPQYIPPHSQFIRNCTDTKFLISKMYAMMEKIRDKKFPYRVDGVILFPVLSHFDRNDVMANAMAFKINTAENYTKIEYGYVSIGRSGKATPMLHVEPCEVNETTVTDVNVGSFPIFYRLGLHEGETILVYSAGDVIPQMKVPKDRKYPKHANVLRIEEVCPYCGSRLVDYECINSSCPRLITGTIVNFLEKLGTANMSDGTVEALRKANLIHKIEDLFSLKESDISKIPGFAETSAHQIVKSIHDLQKKPISYAAFFGALSIPNSGRKTWEKIFDRIDPKEFMRICDETYVSKSKNKYSFSSLYFRLLDVDGIGPEKRDAILAYLESHWNQIMTIYRFMNIVVGEILEGEVVFTGFRDSIWSEKFRSIGYRVADNVTKTTTCLIAANLSTGKAKKALALGIMTFPVQQIEEAYEYCKDIAEQNKKDRAILNSKEEMFYDPFDTFY